MNVRQYESFIFHDKCYDTIPPWHPLSREFRYSGRNPTLPGATPLSTAGLTIRRARPEDLDALLQLEQSSFTSDLLSRRRLRHWITAPNGILLVATDPTSTLLGSCLVITRRNSRTARLYSIASTAEARGRGVGAALLKAAEQQAQRHGCLQMSLEVAEGNSAAIGLYKRAGYEKTNLLPAFYEDGRNALRFRKSLLPDLTAQK